MLVRWGYPYVFEDWCFHMTLTRRLTPAEKAVVLPAVTDFLGAAPARPRRGACGVIHPISLRATLSVAERLTLKGPHVLERMA